MTDFYRYPSGWIDIFKLADSENKITHWMCCICFEYFEPEALWVDPDDGQIYDMCVECGERERL